MPYALATVLLACCVWFALRWLPAGADGHGPLPYLLAVVRFLWVPLLACIAISAVVWQWPIFLWGCGLLLVFAGVEHGCGHPATRGSAAPGRRGALCPLRPDEGRIPGKRTSADRHADDAGSFTAMTLNCRYGQADPAEIVDAVRTGNVSVLALQELTDDLAGSLQDAGLSDLLPHRRLGVSHMTDNGGFNGIWSRFPATAGSRDSLDISAADVPTLTFELPCGRSRDRSRVASSGVRSITVVCAHTKSPMRGCRDWSTGIRALGGFVRGSDRCHATMIMGDLNSHRDHPSFRSLLDSGLHDAAELAPQRPRGTFPARIAWPRIPLDHILVSAGLECRRMRVMTISGTDHRAVIADMAPQPYNGIEDAAPTDMHGGPACR